MYFTYEFPCKTIRNLIFTIVKYPRNQHMKESLMSPFVDFVVFCCHSVRYLLAIVMSVLQFTTSKYPLSYLLAIVISVLQLTTSKYPLSYLQTFLKQIRSRHGRVAQQLDLLSVQSVLIITKVVSSNPAHGEVYSIQHYVIKLAKDLQQVGGFLMVLRFLHQ